MGPNIHNLEPWPRQRQQRLRLAPIEAMEDSVAPSEYRGKSVSCAALDSVSLAKQAHQGTAFGKTRAKHIVGQVLGADLAMSCAVKRSTRAAGLGHGTSPQTEGATHAPQERLIKEQPAARQGAAWPTSGAWLRRGSRSQLSKILGTRKESARTP